MLVGLAPATAMMVAALWYFPLYAGAGLALLVALVIVALRRSRKVRDQTRKIADEAFLDAYGQLSPPPSIVVSFRYGYPAFEIKFRSKSEMVAAAARNAAFKAGINKAFEGYGPRSRPFSADMAIFFTYEGYFDELRARYKTA
jgi:hypothetical protein